MNPLAPVFNWEKEKKNINLKCFLIDSSGSGLFNKVKRGVMYTREETDDEGSRICLTQ